MRTWRSRGLAMALAVPLAFVTVNAAWAADHNDPPNRSSDQAADIADFFAWSNASQELVLVTTYAGLLTPGTAPVYDADLLYGFHVDADQDGVADFDIWVRFGQNGAGEWGVEVVDLPGEAGALSGAVGTNIANGAGGDALFAGMREDPFFFDLAGFNATVGSLGPNPGDGSLMFDGTDALAGTNVMAIVLKFDVNEVWDGATPISVWTTTARI